LKKKVLTTLAFATLAMTLAGCQPADSFRKGFEEGLGKTQEKQIVKSEPLSEKEYPKAIYEKSQAFYKTELTETLVKLSATQTVDEDMMKWLYDKVDKMDALSAEVIAIEPPESYKDVDKVYEESMKEFRIWLQGFRNALDKRDFSLAKEFYENSTKGEKLLNRANGLLSMTYDLPAGTDGTITTRDLKELDSLAGIDRDSVLVNITEEGEEFIGKWGFVDKDGKENISIVLHKDGSYEGYGNGEYPNKEQNYMEGTWSYDFLGHTLHITNDTVYMDGHLKSLENPVWKFDVQAFADGKMMLMNLNSLQTFQYQKLDGVVKKTASIPAKTPLNTKKDSKSTVKPTSSASVNESQLLGTWNLDADNWDYEGLWLNEDGTGGFSWNTNNNEETYRGTWELNGNTVIVYVEEATQDYGKAMKNPPKSLSFDVVSFEGKTMQLKHNGKVAKYELYE